MDMDNVSLSASDREGDGDMHPAGEQHTEAESEALGRGKRKIARSRSLGESEDEADLRTPLKTPHCLPFQVRGLLKELHWSIWMPIQSFRPTSICACTQNAGSNPVCLMFAIWVKMHAWRHLHEPLSVSRAWENN